MEIAQRLALEEYEKFSMHRLTEDTAAASDTEFENIVKKIEQKKLSTGKTHD